MNDYLEMLADLESSFEFSGDKEMAAALAAGRVALEQIAVAREPAVWYLVEQAGKEYPERTDGWWHIMSDEDAEGEDLTLCRERFRDYGDCLVTLGHWERHPDREGRYREVKR